MNEEVTRTRVILKHKIEEKFPINYDVAQELAEKADELNSCIFVPHCGWYKDSERKYVDYLVFDEVLVNFILALYLNLTLNLHLKTS